MSMMSKRKAKKTTSEVQTTDGVEENVRTEIVPSTQVGQMQEMSSSPEVVQTLDPMAQVFVPRSTVNEPTVGDSYTDTVVESHRTAAVSSMERQSKSVYIEDAVEGIALEFLLDTEAESCIIAMKELKKMSRNVRTVFQDQCGTLTIASGQGVLAYRPVLRKITVAGRTILDTVYATDVTDRAMLGLQAMQQLGCRLTLTGVEVTSPETENIVRRFQKPTVRRVKATSTVTIPQRSNYYWRDTGQN